jgi:cytochrome c-type biogenesis protein CcmH
MKKTIWIIGILVAFITLSYSIAAAQDPTPSDDEVNAIASQLFCPVCENIPLDVCPTTACHQWREEIRQMLAEGKTPDEIKQYFVDNYGARVLSEPPAQGLNWMVYIVPPVLFAAGAILLVLAFRNWKKGAASAVPNAQNPSNKGDKAARSALSSKSRDPYAAQLEEELRKRE